MTTLEKFKKLEVYLEKNKHNISETERSKIIISMLKLTSKIALDALNKNKLKNEII